MDESHFWMERITVRWLAVALLVLVIGGLAIYAWSTNKAPFFKAECPRCHHRIPRNTGRCSNCGWSEEYPGLGTPQHPKFLRGFRNDALVRA